MSGPVLRIRIPADMPQLPCLFRNHTWCNRVLTGTVYEPLVRFDPRSGRYVGVLATAWKHLDGGRTFWIELRKGVKWHNGKPLVSRDVKHTLYVLRSGTSYAPHPAVRLLRKYVDRVSFPTDRHLEIHFTKPFGPILELLAALPILPSTKTLGEARTTRERVVGTGPYRFLQWWPGERISFSRFRDYWGPPAHAYRIEYHVIPSMAAARKRLAQSKLDLILDLTTTQYRRALAGPGKVYPFSFESAQFAYLALNTKGLLADPKLRRAFGLLLDREKLMSAMPGRRPRLLEQPVWILGPQAPTAKGTGIPHAPAEASKLLSLAGWRKVGKRWLKGGKPLRIELLTAVRFTAFNRGLRAAARALAAVGVELRVRKVLWGELVLALKQRRFDAIALASPLCGPWNDLVDTYHSGSVSSGNYGGYKSDEMDNLLKKMLRQIDPTRRRALERQIFLLASKSAPIIPLFAPRTLGLSRRPLDHVIPTPTWLDITRLRLN